MMRRLLVFVLLVGTAFAQDVFRITPQRPIEELRREALAATPPQESGKRNPELIELTSLDPTIKLDIRYATSNNFLSTPVYEQARAFLQEPAAKALVKAHRWLKKRGYGLLIHDAYRPWYVTKIFWDATPPAQREFVADPASGSRHNRGAAVDLTLYDLQTGAAVEMPSLYDEFSPRAYPNYTGGTAEQRRLRDLLREAMERHGFKVIENEWWHFDYQDWREYPILNVPFSKFPDPLLQGAVLFSESDAAQLSAEVQRIGSPDTQPKLIHPAVEPRFPRPSEHFGNAGPVGLTIEFSVLVAVDGQIREIRLVRSGGPAFDSAAFEAVRRWRYRPAVKGNKPVPARIRVTVNYRRM